MKIVDLIFALSPLPNRLFSRTNTFFQHGLLFIMIFSLSCSKIASRKVAGEINSQDSLCCDYTPGSWWRDIEALDRVLLSAAEIVISHNESVQDSSSNRFYVSSSKRSKKEARDLAIRIAREVHKNPQRFEDSARQFSDDSLTVPKGGYLGVFRASWVHEKILDALANLKEGETSRVIETPIGFHIIRRLKPPDEEWITYQRIVIQHKDIPSTYVIADIDRSKKEAKELADEISVAAKKGKKTFETLIKQFSSLYQAKIDKPYVTLSTYERDAHPFTMTILSDLKENETSEAFATRFGYNVVKRLPLVPKSAEKASYLSFDTGNIPTTDSKKQNMDFVKQVEEVRSSIKRNPKKFDELAKAYPSGKKASWIDGSNPVLEKSLIKQEEGGLLPTIVLGDGRALIVRKEATLSMQEARPILDPIILQIPKPPPLKYEDALTAFDPAFVAITIPKFTDSAIKALDIQTNHEEIFKRIMSNLADRIRQSSNEDTLGLISKAGDEIAKELGEQTASEFVEYHRRWFNETMANY